MEFGKISDISKVDFNLPPKSKKSLDQLSLLRKENTSPAKIFIGTPAWGCKNWIGKIYPPKTHPKDFFKYYVQNFSTIELNTTFYQIPDESTIERWKTTSPPHFLFCPKVYRGISHSPDLGTSLLSRPMIQNFVKTFMKLEDRLGLSFLQIPSEADLKNFGSIFKKLIELLPKDFPLAVEFRHPSWFEGTELRPKLFDFLVERNISTIITDVAGRRDVLHSSITTKTLMIRFIGNSLHESDYKRIDSWVVRLKEWIDSGLERIYFMTHEPDDILAPELAQYLIERINSEIPLAHQNPIRFIKNPSPEQNQQLQIFNVR